MAKPTSMDVAKLAGVSQTTVSFVLNNRPNASISAETRDRVLAAAHALNYEMRSRSPKKKSLTLGVIVPTLSNLYYPFLVQCIEIEARSKGLNVIVMDVLRDERNERFYFDFLKKGTVDGILSLFTPCTILPKEMPVVILGEVRPGTLTDTVALNSYQAGQIMADHLLSLGHEHFAYVTTPFANISNARQQRFEGIQSRLMEAGLSDHITVRCGNAEREITDSAYEYNVGYELTQQLLDEHTKATAIIAVNDTTAAGCISALHARGVRIPNDIAVGGFDNLLISQMLTPQLTSVDQMPRHACRIAMDMLIHKINNPELDSLPVRMEYQPNLIVRGSTDINIAQKEMSCDSL